MRNTRLEVPELLTSNRRKTEFVFRVFAISFLIFTTACNKALQITSGGRNEISGSVSSFSASYSNSQASQAAQGCVGGTVSLHAIDIDGSINDTAIATSSIQSDGKFKIKTISSVQIGADQPDVKYVLKTQGCGSDLFRPVTDRKNQNITGGSTLIAFSTNVDDNSKKLLTQQSRETIAKAIEQLDTAASGDLETLLTSIIASPALTQVYKDITNIEPVVLKELPPSNVTVTSSTSISEGSSNAFVATVSHWNSTYQVAYEWSLDGVIVSNSATWNYLTKKNSQGNHVVTLRVGSNNGSNGILTGTLAKTVTTPIVVNNTYLPTAPIATLVGTTNRNFLGGLLTINTGTEFSQCESFSKLAITIDTVLPPIDPSSFNLTCSDEGLQNISFFLTSFEGARIVSVWAMDSSGTISNSPSSVNLFLDQTPPVLTLPNLSKLKGGADTSIVYSAVDSLSGLKTVRLDYAADGSTFSLLANLLNQSSPLTWTVPTPNPDISTAKLKLTATDNAGNSTTILSDAFAIDSTAPTISIASPAVNSKTSGALNISGVCESGLSVALSGNISSNVSVNCSSGSYAATVNLSGTDGAKAVQIKQTDDVGNVSTLTRNFMLDKTAPVVAITSPTEGFLNRGTLTVSGTCENAESASVIISGTALTSPVTATCTAGNTFSQALTLSSGDGSKNIIATQTDAAGNSGSDNLSVLKDSTPPELTITSPVAGTAFRSGSVLAGVCETGLTVAASGHITSTSTVCASTAYSLPIAFSATDGIKNITVTSTDAAGNTSNKTIALERDSSLPALTLSTPASGAHFQSAVSFTGTCEVGHNVTVSGGGLISGGSFACSTGNYSQSFNLTAGEGSKSISVAQTGSDAQTTTFNRSIVRDNTPPTITLTSPASGSIFKEQVTVTGSCESDGHLVSVSGSGALNAATGTCTSDAFSIVVTLNDSSDGAKALTISQTDSADNLGTATLNVIRDTSPPALTIANPTASASFMNSVTLTGACETGLTVTASGADIDSTVNATCTASAYSIAVSLAGNDGSKTIQLTSSDSVGNQTNKSISIIKDNVAPTLTQTLVTSPVYSSLSTVTFGGACETGVSVVVTGSLAGSASCTNSAWTFTDATHSTDNTYNYTIKQTDSAGNISTVTASWIRDATLPTLTLTSPNGAEILNGGTSTTIAWSATDFNFSATPITIQYSANNGSSWSTISSSNANSGTYSWTLPTLNSSTMLVRIVATDLAGNTKTVNSASTFVIDSSNPSVSLASLDGGQLLKGGSTQVINWSATDNNFVTSPISLAYSNDSGTTWTAIVSNVANSGSYPWTLPSVTGNGYKVRVTAVDKVSRTGQAVSSSSFSIDATAPAVTLTSLTGGQVIPGFNNYSIQWTATDTNFGAKPISIYLSSDSGGAWTQIAGPIANTGSYIWSVNVADGTTYRVRVEATDSVGNITSSSSSSNFRVSSAAPVLTQTGQLSNILSRSLDSVTYAGACSNGFDVNIAVPSAGTQTVSCNSGAWTWTTPTYSSDGARTFIFSQTNNAPLTTTVQASWIRDTTAPDVTNVLVNEGVQFASTSTLTTQVTLAEENISSSMIRLKLASASTGDCQSEYADDGWESHSTATMTHIVNVAPTDGAKKICAWGKDAAGNVSVISPSLGTDGVDFDSISFSSGNPPRITLFGVINASGGGKDGTTSYDTNDTVKISWTVTDNEGLANNPVTLEYSINNTVWIPIESNYGNLSNNPKIYSSDYYGFSAPASTYFRIRIKAVDMAGNNAITVVSDIQNGNAWSVFAGNTDRGIGGDAKAATIVPHDNNRMLPYAVSPKNGDIYTVDYGYGIKKVDAKTGKISLFIATGTTNLSTSGGTLSATTKISVQGSLLFDNNNKLYYAADGSSLVSHKIWQINVEDNTYKLYFGGGLDGGAGATPTNAFVTQDFMTFDESNSLYYLTSCTPGTWDSATGSTSTQRMMKVTQKSNQTAGTVSIVAGNCVKGTPVSGQLATSTPLTGSVNRIVSNFAVWNNGSVIYFRSATGTTFYKILNGYIYTTSLPTGESYSSLAYNPLTNTLYMGSVSIYAYTPKIDGANGEVLKSTYVSSEGTGVDCSDDGVDAASACVYVKSSVISGAPGQIFFGDGGLVGAKPYRIRYIDSSGKVRTIAGTKPFYGDSLDRSLIKGNMMAIYYKQGTEDNLGAFPEGLYFYVPAAPLLGRINPTGTTDVVWGNQTGVTSSTTYPANTPISKGSSIGQATGELPSTGAQLLSFDSNGLPWILDSSRLTTVTAALQPTRLSTSSSSTTGNVNWMMAPTTNNPVTTSYYYAFRNNLTLRNKGAFSLGAYKSTNFGQAGSVLRYFDFANNTITHIMGTSTGVDQIEDKAYPADLRTETLSSRCEYNTDSNNACFTRYVENNPAIQTDDELYFSEYFKMRKITNPLNGGSQTLTTLFTTTARINNFILSKDNKRIFYLKGGKLFCHAIALADQKSYCKNAVANHTDLGPTTGMDTIGNGVDNMTWKDDSTLLIATGKGEIFQYSVPAE